jgi:hypothetical protein
LLLRKSSRARWILFAALALCAAIMAIYDSRLSVSYRTRLTGCARDNGTGGGSGIVRWARRIGVPVTLLEVPVWEASQVLQASTGNCVLTAGDDLWSPIAAELDAVEWLSTADWISRGNSLVIVTTAPKDLPEPLRTTLNLAGFTQTAAERIPVFEEMSVARRPQTSHAPLSSGEILWVASNGPRWNVDPTTGQPISPAKPQTKPNAPSIAKAAELARARLAGDARGGVLFRFLVGRGSIYILLDDFAWTNAGFDQGDNARVLADVLAREVRGGVLAFDEYRHGHGRAESFLVYLLRLPGSVTVLWLGTIWALFYTYGRNVRLKPPEPFAERERRTAQEYIDAVAQLYERARAAPLVVGAVARRLRQVARSSVERQKPVEKLLERADRYAQAQDRPAAPASAIQLTRELIQLRKQIYGSRKVS